MISPIRAKAAVLRGVPKDSPPAVPGISLQWDERERGFIFSRKHVEKVQAALSAPATDQNPIKSETPSVSQPEPPATAAAPAPDQEPQASRGGQVVPNGGAGSAEPTPLPPLPFDRPPAAADLTQQNDAKVEGQAAPETAVASAPGPLSGSGRAFLSVLNKAKGKAKAAIRDAGTADYLALGNIVSSYGGGHDRVMAFDPTTGDITVQAVERDGVGGWRDVANERPRTHRTLPDDRQIADGPIQRGPSVPTEGITPNSQAPLDDSLSQTPEGIALDAARDAWAKDPTRENEAAVDAAYKALRDAESAAGPAPAPTNGASADALNAALDRGAAVTIHTPQRRMTVEAKHRDQWRAAGHEFFKPGENGALLLIEGVSKGQPRYVDASQAHISVKGGNVPEAEYGQMPPSRGRISMGSSLWGKEVAPSSEDGVSPKRPATEAPKIARAIPLNPVGKQATAITARGREIPVEYAIAELDDLTPSQMDDGRDNPAFPQELQPRDRSGNKSQEQIRKIAGDLKPELLGENPQASAGAPIVTPSGVVISGNGRTLALRRAHADGTADGYRAWLGAQGYDTAGMKNPVLVRVLTEAGGAEELAALAREANERDTAAMSASEQAMADASAMSPAVLERYRGGDVDTAANRDFVRAFLGSVVAPGDMGSLIRNDGSMTQDAVRRVQGAMLAAAYGDADLIGALLEATESHIKSIGGALIDAAPSWARMRTAADRGDLAEGADMTAPLLEAVRIVDRSRREGRKIEELTAQGDMFSGTAVSDRAKAFLEIFYRNAPAAYTGPRSRDKVGSALVFIAVEAEKTQPGEDMFGAKADPAAIVPASADKLRKEEKRDADGQAGLFARRPAEPDPGAGAEASGRAGGRPEDAEVADGERAAAGSRSGGGGQPGVGASQEYPTTLEAIAPEGRFNHLYAEHGGRRFYLGSVQGNPDRRVAEMRSEFPGVAIYAVDRADGTSINGGSDELRASIGPVPVPASEANLARRAAEGRRSGPRVEKVSDSTLKSWRRYLPGQGTVRGWHIFDDRAVGGADGGWVLLSAGKMVRGFKSKPDAVKWGKANPEATAVVTPEEQNATPQAAEGRGRTAPRGRQPDVAPVAAERDPAAKRIEDLGEKIGGARKDTAEPTGPRAPRGPEEAEDQRPAWRRRYEVGEILKSSVPGEQGRFGITDTKTKRPVGGHGRRVTFTTREEAEAAVPLAEVSRNHIVRKEGDGYAILRVISDRKRPVVKAGFASEDDANRYMADHAVEIIEHKTRIDDTIHPALEEAIREGAARRDGDADVTGEDFMEVFGFRGVEFGNWNNGAERQHILNQSYDALLDLAEIMGVPPKAISLNGALGLAFGARGHGLSGSRAHYESDAAVINLTKIKGAGALAHEWMHAFDHYLARQDGKSSSEMKVQPDGTRRFDVGTRDDYFASHGFSRGERSAVRPEVREAFTRVMDTIQKRAVEYTEDKSTRAKISEREGERLERVLADMRGNLATEQRWGSKKMAATPAQLARFDAAADAIRAGNPGEQVMLPSKGYSAPRVAAQVAEISALFKDVRGSQQWGRRDGRLSGWVIDLDAAILNKQKADAFLAEAQKQKVKEKTVTSEFASEAWRLDRGAKADYWSMPHEMLSRAFEAFVYDRLQGIEARNDFLAYEKHNDRPEYLLFGVKPYPEGAERTAMNEAFQSLFDTLDTRETDQGTELFQRELGAGEPVNGRTFDAALAPRVVAAAEARLRKLVGDGAPRVEARRGRPGVSGQFDASAWIISLFRTDKGWRHTLDHEAIHALRDMGVIRPDEWRALVRAARADADLMERIEAAYGDLTTEERMEEAVAEMFANWRREREDAGPVRVAFQRIAAAFRALAAALRGEGYLDGAQAMERIASGDMGGRGPGGGQSRGPDGRFTTMEQREGSPFGPVLHGYEGRWREAAMELERRQSGEAPGALSHPEVGPIALVWGKEGTGRSDGFGLAKLIAWHPEVLDDLQERLNGMRVTSRSDNRVQLHGDSDQASVSLTYHGADRVWLLTAYDRGVPRRTERSIASLHDLWGDLAPSPRRGTDNMGYSGDQVKEQRDLSDIKAALTAKARKAGQAFGSQGWRKGGTLWSDLLTDAMAKSSTWNLLSLVPGRPLFKELGAGLGAAQSYISHKDEMDALRGEWHARAAGTAEAWMKLRRRDGKANARFMDLLHEASIAQVDPSRPFVPREVAKGDVEGEQAEMARQQTHAALAARFERLPAPFREMWGRVLGDYDALATGFERAILENIEQAAGFAVRRAERDHAKTLRDIDDDGLTGAERDAAIAEADAILDRQTRAAEAGSRSRMMKLRAVFESNRLAGPYVPLARKGSFFVTVRDEAGKVVSFSLFETAAEQRAFRDEAEKGAPGRVKSGTMEAADEVKAQVDPAFVADVERVLAGAGAGQAVMDAIWQRWLETLPDQSIRKSRIHRKNREGYSRDALRAYGDQMFHGGHQLAKLKWGMQLADDLEEATIQARGAADPNRAMAVVNEMKKRHAFTMNPAGSAAVAAVSGLAFTLQLAASPAAALVNITQTTVVGVPMLAARFQKAGTGGAIRQIGAAMRDFTRAKGDLGTAAALTGDEKAAMAEAIRRGSIDKTQAHSLAGIAEHGVSHSPARDQVQKALAFFFHHAERMNRQVTFLAAYRLARGEGTAHEAAIEAAIDATWETHFDTQNNSRPRFMQGDLGKLLTTFRSFQVNMLWRLFRDLHQAFNGASPELRREARLQAVGITLSMFAHAGIRGVWGYALLTTLLSMFLPGDDDDLDAWLQDALLMEGDGAGATAWNFIMGAALNGAPGQVTGVDLTNRIGMPELWFREQRDGLKADEAGWQYVKDALGPAVGWLAGSVPQGLAEIGQGEYWRGTERIVPKAIRDPMKAARYAWEGVETKKGDVILDHVQPHQILTQALGFTPAQVAERYREAGLLRKRQDQIVQERSALQRQVGEALAAGKGLPDGLRSKLLAFNRRYPEYPITSTSLKASMRARATAHDRAQLGVVVNPKLEQRLQEGLPKRTPTL